MMKNNELIIKFLGHSIKDGVIFDKSILNLEGSNINNIELLPSWSWLMPVVEYVENLDCSEFSYNWVGVDGEIENNFTYPKVEIEGDHCMVYFDLSLDPIDVIAYYEEGKLQSTYKCVIDFIK